MKATVTRSKVKSRAHLNVAQLCLPSNVPTKYQLPTPYSFRDIAWTKFYRLRSLRQGQMSIQGHTITMHTFNPQPMSLVSIKFLHITVFRYIARTRFYRSRSLWQGQKSNEGHTMMLHTYIPLTNVPTMYQHPAPYGF